MCIRDRAKGATFKQVTREDIAELSLPLPPFSEQERLSAILDSAADIQRKQAVVLADINPVSYTHLRAHETVLDLVCRLLLEKKK